MLLDRRQPVDAFVVGVGVVGGRDEARDLVGAEVLEGLDPEGTVLKEVPAWTVGITTGGSTSPTMRTEARI